MTLGLDRCANCGRLSLRPCARFPACAKARLAHEKYLEASHVPELPLRRSAGRFVLGFDWEAPRP